MELSNKERDTKISLLENEVETLKSKTKSLSNKIDLIGCRDFLRRVFSDFCFFFGINQNGNYKQTAKLIIKNIKEKKDNLSLQEFEKKVNLTAFIEQLGNIIDESDNVSHFYFKELSIKYRNQDISDITKEEIIRDNIIKCNTALNYYSKMNFDSIFNFFINNCNYPKYIINKLEMNENGFSNAIISFNNSTSI